MSNEALPSIGSDIAVLIKGLDDEFLADVPRLWDCDAQDWFGESVIVFRFENEDLLVWRDDGKLHAHKGAVDTASFDPSILPMLHLVDSRETCLVWRPDPSCADCLGERALSRILLASLLRS